MSLVYHENQIKPDKVKLTVKCTGNMTPT